MLNPSMHKLFVAQHPPGRLFWLLRSCPRPRHEFPREETRGRIGVPVPNVTLSMEPGSSSVAFIGVFLHDFPVLVDDNAVPESSRSFASLQGGSFERFFGEPYVRIAQSPTCIIRLCIAHALLLHLQKRAILPRYQREPIHLLFPCIGSHHLNHYFGCLDRTCFRAKRADAFGDKIRIDEIGAFGFLGEELSGKRRFAGPIWSCDDQNLFLCIHYS